MMCLTAYDYYYYYYYYYYCTARETAAQMVRGATQDRSMDIQVIDNETQREIWSDATTVL